jgi:hypothetical protein
VQHSDPPGHIPGIEYSVTPIVHFWRYHDTGKDAEAPPNVVIPPQHSSNEPQSGAIQKSDNYVDRQSAADRRYALSRAQLTSFSNQSEYELQRPILSSLLSRADEIRNSVHEDLTRVVTHGDKPATYHWLEQAESNVDLTMDMASGLLAKSSSLPKPQLAQQKSTELRDLRARYTKTVDLLQKYTHDPNAIGACNSDPNKLARSLAQAEQSMPVDRNDDPTGLAEVGSQLQVLYADLLITDVAARLICYQSFLENDQIVAR